MISVLADFHHSDLTWSLDLLTKRLGWKLYRPYGMPWYDQGYYRIYGDLRRKDPERYLAKQYLVDTIFDYFRGTGTGRETHEGCVDYPRFNLLTLEQAKKTPIDIVICSVNENEPYFAKLKEFYPKAKFVRHVGNNLDVDIDEATYPNLLASAIAPYKAFKGHKILYRQEFDLNLFKYLPPSNHRNIYSFQNGLEFDERAWDKWIWFKRQLRDYSFKSFGVSNDNGRIYPKREYIKEMLNASFIYQVKRHDGYSHVVHNAFCLGRPPIIYEDDYADKIAGPLLEDEKTCLFIDDNIEAKIRKWSETTKLREMSLNAKERFHYVVDFEQEAFELKMFLKELV